MYKYVFIDLWFEYYDVRMIAKLFVFLQILRNIEMECALMEGSIFRWKIPPYPLKFDFLVENRTMSIILAKVRYPDTWKIYFVEGHKECEYSKLITAENCCKRI